MPTPQELWESYFYPETYDPATTNGTLRNLLGERDGSVLAQLEYGETSDRYAELMRGEVAIARTYDARHLCAIHQHLFQDVYDWAGEYRTVNIFKSTPRGFADVGGGEIDRYMGDVQRLVDGTAWDRLGRDAFAERAAEVFAYLNQAHPFREGNGRASKVFMEHVAEQSPFTLDYARVTPAVWNDASMYSGPDLFTYEPQAASLVPVFYAIAVDRQPGVTLIVDDAVRGRSTLRASYPNAPGVTQLRGDSRSVYYVRNDGAVRGTRNGNAGEGRE